MSLGPEELLHRAVAQFMARAMPPDVPYTTIGHGGGGKARGARLKAMGMQPGWPDILVLRPGLGRVGFIELKAMKGRLSPEQKIVHARITLAGGDVYTAFSLEEVEEILLGWNIPLRASVRSRAA